MVLGKDDPRLLLCEDHGIVPDRHITWRRIFVKIYRFSDKLVLMPESHMIVTTDVEWPIVKEEL